MVQRKIIALLMTCIMSITFLVGCTVNKTSTSSSASVAPSTTSGSSTEKVLLTVLYQKHPLTKDVNEMQWLTEMINKVGVQVEWQQISADWDQKKSAMFASGEVPDVLIDAVTTADQAQYVGLFEDLTSWIQEDAPNIQRMFSEHPETKIVATAPDGKIYGVPRYRSIWPEVTATMFINKVWLDNLGLQIPTNWDELEQVLIAFRDLDPNRNGEKDEIPMDFNPMTWYFTPKNLLGGLGLPMSNMMEGGYFVENGTVKSYFVDERYQTLLKFLQKLYSEDLISKEAVTQDYSKYQAVARGEGDVAKVGFTWGWETGDRFGAVLRTQYVSVPQLKQHADSTVKINYGNDFVLLNIGTNAAVMSSKCQNKDAAMRFIDAFYDEKTSIQVTFGGMNDVDKGTKDNGDGTYTILPSADPQVDIWTWQLMNTMANDNAPYYFPDSIKKENRLIMPSDFANFINEKTIYNEQIIPIDDVENLYPQVFMKYTQDETNTMAMNQANINNIAESMWATWMTDSTQNIDSLWDAYIKSIDDAGLKQNLEIRQKAFDAYLTSLGK